MVVNKNCVLDEGVLKWVPEVKAMKYDQKLLDRWKHEAHEHYLRMPDDHEGTWMDDACSKYDFPHDTKARYREEFYKKIQSHFNYIPFTPFIVFNVSPNWKGCKFPGKPCPPRIELFKKIIKQFFAISNRFTQIDYAIEGGSENTHLHAHVVARINPAMLATVVTQLQKGNLSNGFRKVWLKNLTEAQIREGMGGILKGKFAIQTSLMRKEEFLQDKLNYLKEELKPEDHKNLVDLKERETIYFQGGVSC